MLPGSLRGIALLLCVLMVGCASHPPSELIIRDDHLGLAAWYEQEAIRLRRNADDMRGMALQYANPSFQPSPKETKSELIAHCELFITYYTHAAEEAEALAKLHRERDKSIP